MTQITLSTSFQTAEQHGVVDVQPFETSAASGPRRRMPLFVPADQAYYWTREWQEGEGEALREIAEGKTRRFSSGADALRWLMDGDGPA